MMIRVSKCALMLAVSFFFSLVVFSNTTDYDSNYQFVHHVLSMDTTFPGNHGMWRALRSTHVQTAFYLSIICWESVTCLLCWWASVRLLLALKGPTSSFNAAKIPAIVSLTLGCLLWLVAFIDVGGEWFLMWQSKIWNGQDAAFRMFVVMGIVLVYLNMPEPDSEA